MIAFSGDFRVALVVNIIIENIKNKAGVFLEADKITDNISLGKISGEMYELIMILY
jgi:hypothetical protein